MSAEEKFFDYALKKLLLEKKKHDEEYQRVSDAIDATQERMKENRKKFDLIRNK
ncbi:hypothetical protein [Planomicrobium sp. CPCC 101079]|uniref:hypothetical protein n=1 Tax=Planomicrobium sp. CPCC 101079 TaxID=2599618 RepID=UPI0016482DC7|nr:hypothetical protein [Planomicrobium sp. CPCC 101079]